MNTAIRLEALLKRDRVVVASGLVLLTILAWWYLFDMAGDMAAMDMTASMMQDWGLGDLFMLFIMWAIMMVGMMIPSAAPLILTFATINRRKFEQSGRMVSTFVFLSGYLLVWTTFSGVAASAQWGLHTVALLSPMMVSQSPIFNGILLIAAGTYQWAPLKRTCLEHCQSPLSFIMSHWREGTGGALRMGWEHGLYCLGCCWVLMALLFVMGVMNLVWVGLIAAFVLLEKVLPMGLWMGRTIGIFLIAWGLWLARAIAG
jgi:predicted metal-binding membrane protein